MLNNNNFRAICTSCSLETTKNYFSKQMKEIRKKKVAMKRAAERRNRFICRLHHKKNKNRTATSYWIDIDRDIDAHPLN